MQQRVLITGASGDIGRAVMERLLERQARIVAHYFRADPTQLPAAVTPLQADLSEPQQAAGLVAKAAQALGGLDALVQLNGDVRPTHHWTELSLEHWRYEMNVNLDSVFFLAQAAASHLKASGSGRMVLMSSAYATRGGGPTSAAYAIAKAAVESLTRLLARDLAPAGVLVNCVAPGFILDHFSTVRSNRGAEAVKTRVATIPVGHAGEPMDVAREIDHLISPQNRFVTGEVLRIDGGDFI